MAESVRSYVAWLRFLSFFHLFPLYHSHSHWFVLHRSHSSRLMWYSPPPLRCCYALFTSNCAKSMCVSCFGQMCCGEGVSAWTWSDHRKVSDWNLWRSNHDESDGWRSRTTSSLISSSPTYIFFLFNLSVSAFVSVWLQQMTFSGLLSYEARERETVCVCVTWICSIFSTFVLSGLQYRRSVTLQECHVRPDRVGERSRSSDWPWPIVTN